MKVLTYLVAAGLAVGFTITAVAEETRYFSVRVVDQATGRGVPLVELETINHLQFVTDSHGTVAIDEPDLIGETVYFTIRSHGYKFPQDGFGFEGKALDVQPGETATVEVQRRNIAERLYRVTGSGIYRDSVLLGDPTPLENPLLNGKVFGCDSVLTAVYGGQIYWFWGDTLQPHYPLGGNFHVTGATSKLPSQGGLSPRDGVRLNYLVGADGRPRPMAKMPGKGPTWISAVTILNEPDGREQMYAAYVKVRNQLEAYRWGFVVWNDKTQQFDRITSFDERPPIFVEPQTHSWQLQDDDGTPYVYFCNPLPLTRVEARPAAFTDPSQYEGFTCLMADTRPEDKQLDRDTEGRLQYSWKKNTPPLTLRDEAMLVDAGVIKPSERLIALKDVETGRPVRAHSGSVYWNEYRKRWVLITVELNGESSALGEVWFAEADTPTGPWMYARKIVTHERYSFYNPKHHPFFDEDGGRVIYFEGTYTHTFSGNPHPTPRYDYNQIMYRVDLSDASLNLPVAFYESSDAAGQPPFTANQKVGKAAFFALQHPSRETVPVVWDGTALHTGSSPSEGRVVFHAIPMDSQKPPASTVPLYEFVHAKSNSRVYSTDSDGGPRNYRRSPHPPFRIWKASLAE